jgi:FlaA1/EpsC-like NDP-sugar epimerase
MNIFKGQKILVTGGCGSIGSEIVSQLISHKPAEIRVYDNNEFGHFNLSQKLNSPIVKYIIGDIRDRDRLRKCLRGVAIVLHCGAYKHVPYCEENPQEAVSVNVIGTENVIEASLETGVRKLIGISTDKSVNPINTMGATKLLAEKLLINSGFSVVRFGNVLNSSGSVIPIFKRQIESGGPVTITHRDMTRFMMSIGEAVTLVLKSTERAKGRDLFILDMQHVLIYALALEMIKEHTGSEDGMEIKFIGVRPGEKIHELLMTEEEEQIAILEDGIWTINY